MTKTQQTQVSWRELLGQIYGDAAPLVPMFEEILARHGSPEPARDLWSEEDAWLISYPDQFQKSGQAPLRTLAEFFEEHLSDWLNGIHVLPFFPWSSDDGYSITDYRAVDPAYGTWRDVELLAERSRLMVDAVVNHMSAQSAWFERWRDGDPDYDEFFRTAEADVDLGGVVRAREHPLLTPFETTRGVEYVWTTFSSDQVDLDYRNPKLLARMVEVLLDYAARGVSMIRLDAVCFLWKDEATPSIHLPQTHAVVQFIRACLDDTYPGVGLITETNVPHAENISYLGSSGLSEAQAVYQFTLPPLVLHSYAVGRADDLGDWVSDLASPPPGTTFLNFLASHDGVGLRPLEGILSDRDTDRLAKMALAHGGRVSTRRLVDGASSPYELNATWFDMVRGHTSGVDALERHIGSHSIMLAMRGIPAVYVQSLFASANDVAGLEASGAARSVNRKRFAPVSTLETDLADASTRPARALSALRSMVRVRRSHPAFHPDAEQRVLDTPDEVFGIERAAEGGGVARVYTNVSGSVVTIAEGEAPAAGRRATSSESGLELGPWGSAWITL